MFAIVLNKIIMQTDTIIGRNDRLYNSYLRRNGNILTPTFWIDKEMLKSSTYKHILSIYKNPIKEILENHNPFFLDLLIKSKANEDPYTDLIHSKHLVTKILKNTTHTLWYEIVDILYAADLNIDIIIHPADDGLTLFNIEDVYNAHKSTINRNSRIRQSSIVTFSALYNRSHFGSSPDDIYMSEIEMQNSQLANFGYSYPASHYDNPLTAIIDDIDTSQYRKLGFASEDYYNSLLQDREHLIWFDIVNIIRASGYSLSYKITPIR